MKNTQINLKATISVAKALGHLLEKVVFVGGAVVSLYIDDPAADDVRPTKDIDLTFEILSISALEELRLELNKKGFRQSHEDKVACRFRLDDKKVDVMSTEAVGWAPANRWFKDGFAKAYNYNLEEEKIKLLPFPYFLASKFEAFHSRSGHDARGSHDFEDIVYLLNYTSNFDTLILGSDKEVKAFLINCLKQIKESRKLQEAVKVNLYFEDQEERFEMILNKIIKIVEKPYSNS